jgi:hypothetical protein
MKSPFYYKFFLKIRIKDLERRHYLRLEFYKHLIERTLAENTGICLIFVHVWESDARIRESTQILI